jgi:hypothetical protein
MRFKWFIKNSDIDDRESYYNKNDLRWSGLNKAISFETEFEAINFMFQYELVNSTPIKILVNDFELENVKYMVEKSELKN